MPQTNSGFLAIFSDVASADETDYLHWLTREHAQERLSVPGFLAMRVFRAQAVQAARFFIFYRLAAPDVVASEAYLARLNAPTPWSQRIMPKLTNFMRGGGAVVDEMGSGGEGMVAATVLFDAAAMEGFRAASAEIAAADKLAAVRVLQTSAAGTGIQTSEKSLRKGDRSFSAMLLIEALDEAVLAPVMMLADAASEPPQIYRQIFALRRDA
ncbi:MAG: hypothetical protein KF794_09840 [Xanthobacteraceae bacterium]|nr:hypothetical protein [Xanthobacteraceae bacterium]QYK44094.1 MAG: hypothetical protein KF794_09840 [Xanthobacteraceae bacterium]